MEHPSHCAYPLRAGQSYVGRRRVSCLVRQQARIGQVVVRRRLPQRDKHATISIGLDEQMEGVA
jgi:hypothetical protein